MPIPKGMGLQKFVKKELLNQAAIWIDLMPQNGKRKFTNTFKRLLILYGAWERRFPSSNPSIKYPPLWLYTLVLTAQEAFQMLLWLSSPGREDLNAVKNGIKHIVADIISNDKQTLRNLRDM